MSIKSDYNLIPDVVVSPSNVEIAHLENMDSVFNGTLTRYITLVDMSSGDEYCLKTLTNKAVHYALPMTLQGMLDAGYIELKNQKPAPYEAEPKSKAKKSKKD
jgi:hypothetical protein